MKTKHFTLSKINWVGMISFIIGALGLLQTYELSAENMKIILTVTGILTIVLRTFFTTSSISMGENNR